MLRQLQVWLNDILVGTLSEENNLWRFDYDTEWLSSDEEDKGFSISPGLPVSEKTIIDGSSTRPVQWFFSNLLPEEHMRELIAKDAKIDVADSFALLSYYGEESAGSLTLLLPGTEVTQGGFSELSNEDLSERIKQLPVVPLSHKSPKKMSLAGAQHKLPVNLTTKGNLKEPIGSTPSTHILKPEHHLTDVYYQTVINEYFCMRLAKQIRLNVPDVFHRYVPEPIYLIERFDRIGKKALKRLHTIDGCQLLQIDSVYKYHQSTSDSYLEIIDKSLTKIDTRKKLFHWTLFNYLIGNSDAHLKNLTFYLSKEGVVLAPFYDILSTVVYEDAHHWSNSELSVQIGEAEKYAEVKIEDFILFANALGIPDKLALTWIVDTLKRITPEAEKLLTEIEQEEVSAGAKSVKAGELRLIREIIYRVLKENVERIS